MPKKYVSKLNEEERRTFEEMVKKGRSSAQQIRRAQTLLMREEGKTDEEIAGVMRAESWTQGREGI